MPLFYDLTATVGLYSFIATLIFVLLSKLLFREFALSNALLAAMYVGLMVGSRSLAQIRIGPIFFFEAMIACLTILMLPRILSVVKRNPTLSLILMGIYSYAIILLAIGVPEYRIWALKDSVVLLYSLLIPITLATVRNTEDFLYLFRWLAIAAYLSCLFQLISYSFSLVPSHFHLGELIRYPSLNPLASMFVLFHAFVFSFKKISLWHKAGYVISVGLALFLLAIIGQRKAMLGAAICGLIMLFVTARRTNSKRLLSTLLGLLSFGIPIIALLVVFSEFEIEHSIRLFLSGTIGWQDDGTGQWRLDVWRNALDVIREHFFFGMGFGPEIWFYEASWKDVGNFNTGLAHNTYLNLWVRTGLFGTALTAIIVIYVLGRSISNLGTGNLKDSRTSRLDAAILVLALFALSLLIYGTFSSLFEAPHKGLLFWSAIALLATIPKLSREERHVRRNTQPSASRQWPRANIEHLR